MTKEQIVANIRDELGDNGITYYSTDDISDSFDDGYEELCVTAEILESMSVVTLTDDTTYYDLYQLIPGYLRTFAIWNVEDKYWLSHKSHGSLKKINPKWEVAFGRPIVFSVVDFQRIALYPHLLLVDGSTLEIFHKSVPSNPLNAQDVPVLPEQYQIILHNYVMHDLLAQAEEFTKAQLYRQQYVEGRVRLRTYVNNRSFPDRVHMLRQQFSGGSVYGK